MTSPVSLQAYNTFHIDASAGRLEMIGETSRLKDIIAGGQPFHIIGGGSNILLTDDIPGLVLVNRLRGYEMVDKTPDHITVRVASGERWHDFVLWSLSMGYGGLENLSLIPGTVGAAPIQNIGAYGVEVKDLIVAVHALDMETGEEVTLRAEECRFGYRDSIFKREAKGQYFIIAVDFRLTLRNHRIVDDYWAIKEWLAAHHISAPDIRDISKAVIQIRSSKLPDPEVLGNAGSFFKNVEVDKEKMKALRLRFPEIKAFEMPNGHFKIPTGWLIDQCGWKGRRLGEAGCHKDQALVLVNHGKASGREILRLAKAIQADVEERFGLMIEPEVNIWP